jgi:hypothetical protein
MKNHPVRKIGIIYLLLFLLFPSFSHAFEIQQLGNVPVVDDYVVGPGKIELLMDPGETVTRELKITNRSGRILSISIEVEDFTGEKEGLIL